MFFYDKSSHHVPTVAFIYHPSNITLDSMKQDNWRDLPSMILSENEVGPLEGSEAMGALLLSSRPDLPPRYFGSILSCKEARRLECQFNPTTLQVAASVFAHIKLAIQYPNKGACMPHDFDSEEVLELAAPFLGIVFDDDLPFKISPFWKDLLTDEVL